MRYEFKDAWVGFKFYYSQNKIRFYLTLLLSMIPFGGVIYSIQNLSINNSVGNIPAILFWAYMAIWLVNKTCNDIFYALGVDQ